MTYLFHKTKAQLPIKRIINMTEEKGITYFAVQLIHSDGSNDYCYHLRAHQLKNL